MKNRPNSRLPVECSRDCPRELPFCPYNANGTACACKTCLLRIAIALVRLAGGLLGQDVLMSIG